MSTLIVIPARSGSIGLPGKNVKLLHGKPLYEWALNLANTLPIDKRVCISTDIPEILSRNFHIEITSLERPKGLCGPKVLDQPVLKHALEVMSKKFAEKYECVVMLQPTAPGRTFSEVSMCINDVLIGGHSSSWTVSEVPLKYNPYKQFLMSDGYPELAIEHSAPMRRQDLPLSVIRNGNCYAMSSDTVNDDVFLLGKTPNFQLSTHNPINIDDDIDFQKAIQELISNEDSTLLIRGNKRGI